MPGPRLRPGPGPPAARPGTPPAGNAPGRRPSPPPPAPHGTRRPVRGPGELPLRTLLLLLGFLLLGLHGPLPRALLRHHQYLFPCFLLSSTLTWHAASSPAAA